MLPLPSVAVSSTKNKSGKRNGNRGVGGGGSASSQPPSNRNDINRQVYGMMEEEQQQFQPVPGGSTCDKCTAATRNYKHDNRIFAPYIFSRFKGVGHPSSA